MKNTLSKDLIDAINHELKSPLATIKISTELLQFQSNNSDPLKFSQYIQRINSKVDYLTQLINSYTDLLRIQNNFSIYKDQDLTFEQLFNSLSLNHPSVIINSQIDQAQNLIVDLDRLNQVIKALTYYIYKNLPTESLLYLFIVSKNKKIHFSYYAFKNPKVLNLKNTTPWKSVKEFHIPTELASHFFKHYQGKFFHFYNSEIGLNFKGTLPLI